MTDPNYTAIAVLIDRSGSMQAVRADAEKALRAFLVDQAAAPGRATVRLADFDHEYRSVYPSTAVAAVPDYVLVPRGTTALLDGIGRLVVEFGMELEALPESARPSTVIVIIQTDGAENSSTEWTRTTVFDLISAQRARYDWDFVFLGANQDAIAAGADLGIDAQSSLQIVATPAGTADGAAALSAWTSRRRTGDRSGFTDEERRAPR